MILINDNNFEGEVLKSEVPVLVDFWAPWCGGCKLITPIIEELEKDCTFAAKFALMDIVDGSRVVKELGIMGIPTLKYFKDGKVIGTLVGIVSKERIEDLLKKAL